MCKHADKQRRQGGTAPARGQGQAAKDSGPQQCNDVAAGAELQAERPVLVRERYSFPTVSRCPRCGTTDTICRRTDSQNGRQYRQCTRAICRFNYSVNGILI